MKSHYKVTLGKYVKIRFHIRFFILTWELALLLIKENNFSLKNAIFPIESILKSNDLTINWLLFMKTRLRLLITYL